MTNTLPPPQAMEAEQAVLGAILKDAEALNETLSLIEEPSVFYSPKHQIVYKAIIEVNCKAEPVDIVTVSNHLMAGGQLDKIGGRTYLVDLVESVISTANTVNHCKIILDKYVARRLIQTCNEIARSCYAVEQPVDELLTEAGEAIYNLEHQRDNHEGWSMSRLAMAHMDLIEQRQSGEHLKRVVATWPTIDQTTGGLRPKQLYIIGAAKKMGKSTFASTVALNAMLRQKKKVVMFSLEMGGTEIYERFMSNASRIEQVKLRDGNLSDDEADVYALTMGELSGLTGYVDDTAGLTPSRLRAKLSKYTRKLGGCDLVVVDYLHLMTSEKGENRTQEVAHISRSLKRIAMDMDVPVLALAQLNRGPDQRHDDHRPRMSDLIDSGMVEADADQVWLLYRPAYYNKNEDPTILELNIAANRSGETKTIPMRWFPERSCVEGVAETYHVERTEGVCLG